MPGKTYICELSGTTPAKWTDECVVCGVPHPDWTIEHTAVESITEHESDEPWATITVPCCGSCAHRLQAPQQHSRWWIVGVGLAGGAVGVLVCRFLQITSEMPRNMVCLGFAILSFAFFAMLDRRRLPRLAVKVRRDNMAYIFRDRQQAQRFAELNGVPILD